ncbi:trypsin-like peptidase domain-containing protein [Nocardioides sp. CER19]|uniref:S1C family serine protease n=1 Tax=Nocardioides sp. CER19 TaxID=3038538 RepID=UPI00244CCDEC|nr:trypsin-like peptidase domain-containing protein [Nocardioides sp. CER19]MDH2412766.1 trypsin-like peptidase domain-containing protein [Nocardioides sp. CER19]
MAHRLRRIVAATVLAAPLVALPVAAPAAVAAADYGYPGLGGGWSAGSGYGGDGGDQSYGYGGYSSYPTTSTLDAQQATAQESTGVVLVDTVVDYGTGEAAGTGLVLTADGIVLTNHHVVADSTSITVTVPSTGREYVADVVGYDATDDVAVLQLEHASGLATVTTDTGGATTGQAVTAVGNAEGGGTLLAADGTVTAPSSNITVSDDQGGTESLSHLIQVNADVVSGDSGGALLDSDGEVIGMNVAASSGRADVTGYAIPIGTVLDLATRIIAGDTTGDIELGYDGALGVQLYGASGAPVVAGLVDNGAAADAGITTGSTITSFGGAEVTSIDQLSTAVAKHDAGDRVRVGWTDTSGQAHTATVTLGRAPVA